MKIEQSKIRKNFLSVLKEVCGNGNFALHEPSFNHLEKKKLDECIKSSYVSSVGKFTEIFEEKIKKYTKSKYAVCVVNGTSALHLSLLAINTHKDHEVILPALSFVATANSVLYCGADPHFVDIDPTNLGIDPYKLEKWLSKISKIEKNKCINKKTGKIIKAIIPVHAFGAACSIDKIVKVANKYHLEVIEDSAESLGTWYKNKHTGTFGKLGVFSFNGNKIITTGGGGAIITNNSQLAKKIKHLSTQAKLKHKFNFVHNELGYNYRMPNINASLGVAQIDKLDNFLKNKKKLLNLYKKKFSQFSDVSLITNEYTNNWLINVFLNNKSKNLKNLILNDCNKNGYQIRPVWKLLNTLKHLKKFQSSDTKIAKSISQKLISLPSSSFIIDKIN